MLSFDQTSSSKKRKMIYLPEENPTDFLFFFEKGNSGYSFSVRDYSVRGRVTEKYQSDFHCSATELLRRARMVYDAPTIDTNNLEFWHGYTLLGRELIQAPQARSTGTERTAGRTATVSEASSSSVQASFPVLDRHRLEALPKFRKSGDIDRMFSSPNSEDWVTWNMIRLLHRAGASGWSQFKQIIRLANAGADLDFLDSEIPVISCWRLAPTPPAYEASSRERMRRSGNSDWIERAQNRASVEGDSEIDVEFRGTRFLVFAEAKLGSDISLRTTYDPSRNQIARNIDCLIEEAGGRIPAFWMFLRDLSDSRAYMQLVHRYREEPGALASDLPHREATMLSQIVRRLAFVPWRDLGGELCRARADDDENTAAVKAELLRRIGEQHGVRERSTRS